MIEQHFQSAVENNGQAYLDAEKAIVTFGDDAIPFLQDQIEEANPFVQLMIELLLQLISENEAFQTCLDFLLQIEQDTARTVVGGPIPEWLALKLEQDFGDLVSSLLGVHLVKLERIWPYWKTVGLILYLGELTGNASANALIEFIVVTPSDTYRELAAEALVNVGDADVLEKIETRFVPIETAPEELQQVAEQIRNSLI